MRKRNVSPGYFSKTGPWDGSTEFSLWEWKIVDLISCLCHQLFMILGKLDTKFFPLLRETVCWCICINRYFVIFNLNLLPVTRKCVIDLSLPFLYYWKSCLLKEIAYCVFHLKLYLQLQCLFPLGVWERHLIIIDSLSPRTDTSEHSFGVPGG